MAIPIQVSVEFLSKEAYIPRNKIESELDHLNQVRCIQLLNWYRIKSKLLNDYPMIDQVSLNWMGGHILRVMVKNKPPWMLVLHNQNQYLYSIDGTWLNQMSGDVELPDDQIIIVESSLDTPELNEQYRSIISKIDAQIRDVPLFDIKKFIITEEGLNVLTSSEVILKFGAFDDIENKLIRAKYFLSFYKTKLKFVEYIDIRFPKRVIVK